MMKKNDITAAIFMLRITKEINIGAYVTRSLYQQLQDVYNQILEDVIASFSPNKDNMRDMGQNEATSDSPPRKSDSKSKVAGKVGFQGETKEDKIEREEKPAKPMGKLLVPCIEHKDFNHIPYMFLLIMNRFWDNLFKRVF